MHLGSWYLHHHSQIVYEQLHSVEASAYSEVQEVGVTIKYRVANEDVVPPGEHGTNCNHHVDVPGL
jgi:hypothetical protein